MGRDDLLWRPRRTAANVRSTSAADAAASRGSFVWQLRATASRGSFARRLALRTTHLDAAPC